jgi:hypothetical protein
VQDRKWIKKALLFEPKASFKAFPFFVLHNWEAEGQWQRGRLSLLTFFGEAKKVSGCRATPDQQTADQPRNKYKLESPIDRASTEFSICGDGDSAS